MGGGHQSLRAREQKSAKSHNGQATASEKKKRKKHAKLRAQGLLAKPQVVRATAVRLSK